MPFFLWFLFLPLCKENGKKYDPAHISHNIIGGCRLARYGGGGAVRVGGEALQR